MNQWLRRNEQRKSDQQSNLRVQVFEERLTDAANRAAFDQCDDEERQPRDADDDEEVSTEPRAAQRVAPMAE